jgi:hypothetical protein
MSIKKYYWITDQGQPIATSGNVTIGNAKKVSYKKYLQAVKLLKELSE